MDSNMGSKGPSSAFESPTFEQDALFRLDKPVGSASISPCGRDIVLASRQGLHIIDLDSPWSPPRHLAHHTPWEVADVQWSPFAARDYWVVSTSNQKALVWNLAMINSQASIEHYLHAHSRAITDINFSAHHPDIVATCAVDSYVHCWDLRHPSRPAMTFCDWFAGATQVKWNRQDSHVLASSHDKFLRIWDDRKGAHPLRSIEAHATKIYGVDWNRTETNRVATCSLDKTIKFWDYSNDSNKPLRTIHAPFPVWRARHTPFGAGLLAMPQRGDYDLHLYDRREGDETQGVDTMPMVHRFDGHEGQVKEFLWRARGSVDDSRDNREFQLVSWGTDRILRLHRVDEELLAKVGYFRGQQVRRTIPFTRKHAVYRSFRPDPSENVNDLRDAATERLFRLELQHDIGMSGISMRKGSPGIGGVWATGEYPLASMAGKRTRSGQGVDAISWMKGVKIGKRETSQTGMEQSMSSILSPPLKSGQSWDTFDSLAEEITHLADTFSKVTFEDINMQDRRIVVSLHGPFGPEKAAVYIKCRIEIPPRYPSEEPPWPVMESTAETNDETILQATSDLQLIARAYQERQRHSLEAILRYLLGEQSCEESLALLRASPDHLDLGHDQQLELSSSDEDDDDQYGKNQAPGLESSEGMLAVSNAQYNVPLPKACGALWADDGRLVCFFPPKEEKVPSLLDPFGITAGEWSSKSRRNLFEGFGRLHKGSPTTQKPPSDAEVGDSDYESSRSLSESSSSSDVGMTPVTLMPSMAWREVPQGPNRAVSVDESQKSSGGNRQSKSTVPTSRNFVSIHQCVNFLPAKRCLAEEYTLESCAQCCVHNAGVARKYGEPDLADIWEFVSLLLKDEIPLEKMQIASKQEPILLIARRTVSPLRPRDSAIDLSYDSHEEEHQPESKGRIYWGAHPFGRRWLVDALFKHFEKTADIQMLAMLSCVLQRSSKATATLSEDDSKESDSRQHSGLPSYHPLALAERYFPSAEVASSILRPPATRPSFSFDMQKPISGPHSAASSVGATNSDPLTPYSTGLTPPTPLKIPKSKQQRTILHTPMSTSPEQLKHVHRSSSNLASTFAASIARPFSFGTPESSSPPTLHPKPRLSPAPSQLSTMNPNFTAVPSTLSRQASANARGPKPRITPPASDGHHGVPGEGAFETKLKNQDQFHNDGYAAESLLDPSKEEAYSAYRSMYASMLLTWELPIASCKVLQYNTSFHTRQNKEDQAEGRSVITIGKHTSGSSAPQGSSDLRLDIYKQCQKCAATLPPGTDTKRCPACSTRQAPALCHLCHSIIVGLSSPCLNCGHALHLSCRSSIDTHLNGECPAACGCICIDHLVVDVNVETPTFPNASERKASMSSATLLHANEREEPGWRAVGEDAEADENEEAWEDVAAYESLARNLGGRRFLTPKPSRVWRGGGGRKGSFPGMMRRAGSEG